MSGNAGTGQPPSSANAQALPATAYTADTTNPALSYATGANGILCQADTSLNKTGSLMVSAPEPTNSSAPQNVTVTLQGESYQAIFLGVLLDETTLIFRRLVAKWQHRTPHTQSSEQGDTLIEVLLAMVILGVASVALLAGFATSIAASAEHRNFASLDASTRVAANEAIADVQQQAQADEDLASNPFACPATPFTPSFSNLTGSFNVTSTVKFWSDTAPAGWGSTCTANLPQQYTLTVTSTSSGSYSTKVTTVISDPSSPGSPSGVGSPAQLQWLIPPGGGTVGTPITPQPEVAVEDSSGNIVQNDFSSVTLEATQTSGSRTGTMSSTCFGVESYGIVQFSGCSLSASGLIFHHGGRLELERRGHVAGRQYHDRHCPSGQIVFIRRLRNGLQQGNPGSDHGH